jgi:hypothetical protein
MEKIVIADCLFYKNLEAKMQVMQVVHNQNWFPYIRIIVVFMQSSNFGRTANNV